MRAAALMILTMVLLCSGCATSASRAQTGGDPAAAKPARPSQAPGIVHDDFDALWNAAEAAVRKRLFRIARTDYRAGILTTEPMVSKQFFELWRTDAVTAGDVAESSLATVRRTIEIEIEPTEDGRFRATPSVLVERYSAAERRITSAVFYRSLFRRQAVRASGTRETDRGIILPGRYWYEIGDDRALERELRQSIRSRLKRRG
jgi:hypothetical protein